MKRLNAILAGVVFPVTLVGGAQAEWSFQGLGTLGGQRSYAFDVSADGSVVVGMSDPPLYVTHPFRWEDGVMADIGRADGRATDVSADGSVVVGWIGGSRSRAIRWEDGTMTEVSRVHPDPYPLAQDRYQAYGVSTDGSTPVGTGVIRDSQWDPYYQTALRWRQRNGVWMYDKLGNLGGDWSDAYAASADGSVVVGRSENAAGTLEAFRWESNTMVGLGTLGGEESFAGDVSADGSIVVGYSDNLDGRGEAFRWEAGVMVSLGNLGGGTSSAKAISLDGLWIVGSSSIGEGQGDPFLWSEADGMRSIPQMLTDHGVDLTGWNLVTATGISSDGRVMVGYGYNPDGNIEAWRAVIPEPSTLALLSCAAVAMLLAGRRRRRK